MTGFSNSSGAGDHLELRAAHIDGVGEDFEPSLDKFETMVLKLEVLLNKLEVVVNES